MTKHTPGPWTIHWGADWHIIKRADDEDATPIAWVEAYAPTDGDMEAEGKANAKLIAAAPDLKRNISSTIGGLSLLLMAIEHEDPMSELKLRVEDLLKENEQTLEGIE